MGRGSLAGRPLRCGEMRDERAMVNLVDALVFLTVIGVVASMLIHYSVTEAEEPDLERCHSLLLSTEVRMDRFVDGAYGTLYLHEILLTIGNGSESYEMVISLLCDMAPSGHTLTWVLSVDGIELVLGSSKGEVEASSSRSVSDGVVSILHLHRH